MHEAVSNTSPLVYLHRIEALDWLPKIFDRVQVPGAVVSELHEGLRLGYDVPDPLKHDWVEVVEPEHLPSEWLALDLGPGEAAAMALALEHPECVALLDDALARRTATAADLQVWGTLKVLLEAKARGLTHRVAPLVDRLQEAGLWTSEDLRQRILKLAKELPKS